MGTWRDPEKDNWVKAEQKRLAKEAQAKKVAEAAEAKAKKAEAEASRAAEITKIKSSGASKSSIAKQLKQLNNQTKTTIKQIDKQVKQASASSGNFKNVLKNAGKNTFKNLKSKAALEKQYYNEVFPKKQDEQIQQALTANPSLKLEPSTKKGERGVLVNQETGVKYPLPDPKNITNYSGNNRAGAVRSTFVLEQAASGQPYNRRPKEMNQYVRDNHGGGGFFGSVGKAFSSAVSSVGKVSGNLAKMAESSLKSQGKLMTGDFKGAGQEALKGFSAGGNIAGEVGGNVGGLVGDRKTGDIAGRIAADVGANVVTAGGYGAAKAAASSLASGGIQGLLSSKGLQDTALQAAGSYAGVDPNLVKMGLAATKGDKEGLVSGLASQFGASDDIANLAGAAAGGKDMKKTALQQLGSMAGFDPKQLQSGIAALTGDKEGLASGLASQFGANDMMSGMIGQFAGGKGAREVVSDQAGAYADDEVNQALDRAGVNRDEVRQLQEGVANAKRITTDVKKAAQGQYQIAKGDTFNDIAKRMGVSPEELKRMNPQIKDINKIAAGAKLNLPGAEQAGGARNSITDKFLKDANGRTIMGPNNAPIANPQYNREEADKLAAQQQGGTGREINLPEESGIFDQVKGFLGGAVKSAKDFAAKNKAELGLAADVVAAREGYKAGEEGRTEAKNLSNEQLKELKDAGAAFEKMQYDPARYRQEREFIQQRIAGGGITPQEKLLQQQGDLRAARAGAAARLSGMEQQARMGRGATGAGSALAASLAGGQSVMGTQAETNLAREASASQRLEQDIQRQTNLSRQQTSEEADLAQQQGTFGLSRATQTGAVRGDLGNLALGRAEALQKLYGSGADFAKRGLEMFKTPEEQAAEKQQRQMQTESQQLDLEKKRRDVYGASQEQPQQQPPSMQTRAEAARQVSNRQPPPGNQPKPAPKQVDQFNQQNAPQPGQGQGYGVLAPVSQAVQQGQQAVGRVQSTADDAKRKIEEAKRKAEELKRKAEQATKDPIGAFKDAFKF